MRSFVATVLLASAVAGCATATVQDAQSVVDADAQAVAACRFLGEVAGTPGWGGGTTAPTALAQARQAARNQAAKLGATHIVWTGLYNSWVPSARGKAYRCAP